MAKKFGSKGDKEESCGVDINNDGYYCTACGSELVVDQDCPECKRQIDWDRALVELRRSAL